MKEYIEREAVIQCIKTEGAYGDYNLGATKDNEWFCAEINRIPAADVVEVRHGHWIKITKVHPDLLNDSTYNYRCSNCGYMDTHGANVEVPYCWHCGAKMDKEVE